MPSLIDNHGNTFFYNTLIEREQSIELDGSRIFPGKLSDYVVTGAVPINPTPPQFKLLFTSSERIAIKTSTDPGVQDFFDILNDPRLTFIDLGLQSTQDAIAYLVFKNLLTQNRADEVLTGTLK